MNILSREGIYLFKLFLNLVGIEDNFSSEKQKELFERDLFIFNYDQFLTGEKINECADTIFLPSLFRTKSKQKMQSMPVLIYYYCSENKRERKRERLTVKRRIVVGCAQSFSRGSGPWFARRQHPPAGWIFCLASQG